MSNANRRPAAHNPVVYRKVTAPAHRLCTVTRAGAPCGGIILAGTDACPVCAFEDDFIKSIGYPEEQS